MSRPARLLARLKYGVIKALDAFDAHVLNHRGYRRGFCAWLGLHPWWDERERWRGTVREQVRQKAQPQGGDPAP